MDKAKKELVSIDSYVVKLKLWIAAKKDAKEKLDNPETEIGIIRLILKKYEMEKQPIIFHMLLPDDKIKEIITAYRK